MRIGRYELIAEIARGGMGIVYLAVARGPSRFNKLVVVKELKPELSEDDFICSICLEPMYKPLGLTCGHKCVHLWDVQ